MLLVNLNFSDTSFLHACANKLRKQIFNGFNGNLLPEDGIMLRNVVNNKVVIF